MRPLGKLAAASRESIRGRWGAKVAAGLNSAAPVPTLAISTCRRTPWVGIVADVAGGGAEVDASRPRFARREQGLNALSRREV
eukprot:scaffold4051_cov68-Phaeocystis_antarctica.AAC.2